MPQEWPSKLFQTRPFPKKWWLKYFKRFNVNHMKTSSYRQKQDLKKSSKFCKNNLNTWKKLLFGLNTFSMTFQIVYYKNYLFGFIGFIISCELRMKRSFSKCWMFLKILLHCWLLLQAPELKVYLAFAFV